MALCSKSIKIGYGVFALAAHILKLGMAPGPETSLLEIYPKKIIMDIYRDLQLRLYLSALFILFIMFFFLKAELSKHSTTDWLNKLQSSTVLCTNTLP